MAPSEPPICLLYFIELAPNTDLHVIAGVPIRVKEKHPICSREVHTQAANLFIRVRE